MPIAVIRQAEMASAIDARTSRAVKRAGRSAGWELEMAERTWYRHCEMPNLSLSSADRWGSWSMSKLVSRVRMDEVERHAA